MQTYSRRVRVEEKENRRKAFGFVLLTLACVAFMFYFGLPLLARVSNFTYDLRRSGEPVESSDRTPPPPPNFNEIPEFTNKKKLDISGNTEPGVTVVILVNNSREEVVADAGGSFNKTITLNDGGNTVVSYAQDSAGNKSVETSTYNMQLDTEKPKLEISSPQDGDSFAGQKQKQMNVSGTTEKESLVQINDRFVIVGSDGSFSYTIGLNEGENKFTVKSTDQAGNITQQEFSINFSS